MMAAAAERCSRDPCGALCPLLAYLSVGYADYAVLAHVLPQPALRARCQREEPGLWGALWGGSEACGGAWGLRGHRDPLSFVAPWGARPCGILQWAAGTPWVPPWGARGPGGPMGCRVLSWTRGARWLWCPHGARGPWGTASMGSRWGCGHCVYGIPEAVWDSQVFGIPAAIRGRGAVIVQGPCGALGAGGHRVPPTLQPMVPHPRSDVQPPGASASGLPHPRRLCRPR